MKRQKILVCMLALVIMLANVSVGLAKSTESVWYASNERAGSDFEIHIWLEDHKLWGSHDASARRGARIDSSRGEISIKGTLDNHSSKGKSNWTDYIVRWKSGYSDASGWAYLIFQEDGTVYWNIYEVEQPGEYYLPEEAILYRQK